MVEILEQETTVQIRSEQNGRLAKNIVAEAVINSSNRLSFTDDGVKLVTLEDDDVIKACRAFCDVPNKDTRVYFSGTALPKV